MSDVEMPNDEEPDRTDDITRQNAVKTTTADDPSSDDPHKVEKLAKAGEPAVDPNMENPT